jgi:hypothetical protein
MRKQHNGVETDALSPDYCEGKSQEGGVVSSTGARLVCISEDRGVSISLSRGWWR